MDNFDPLAIQKYLLGLAPQERTEAFYALAMEGFKVTVTYTPENGGVREDFVMIAHTEKRKRHKSKCAICGKERKANGNNL